MKRAPQSRGFSLIEVLVAVLVVSVGVLGIMGLQAVTLRTNTGAMLRTQATQFAYNIIDRVRANPTGTYVIAMNAAAPVPVDCEGAGASCTIQQMANYDLAGWLADVAQLPSGDGSITANANIIAVTVQWSDNRDGVAAPVTTTVSAQIKVPAP